MSSLSFFLLTDSQPQALDMQVQPVTYQDHGYNTIMESVFEGQKGPKRSPDPTLTLQTELMARKHKLLSYGRMANGLKERLEIKCPILSLIVLAFPQGHLVT